MARKKTASPATHDSPIPLGLFSKQYRERIFVEPIMQIGDTTFTRQGLVDQLHTPHTHAAAKLTKIFKKLNIHTAYDIVNIPMVDWSRIEGVGECCVRVLCDLLLFHNVPDPKIDRWVQTGFNGGKLRQWNAIIHAATKKGQKRRHVV